MFGIKSWDLDQWFSSNFDKKWFLNIFDKSEKYQNGLLLAQEDKNKLNTDIWKLGMYEILLQYDSKYLEIFGQDNKSSPNSGFTTVKSTGYGKKEYLFVDKSNGTNGRDKCHRGKKLLDSLTPEKLSDLLDNITVIDNTICKILEKDISLHVNDLISSIIRIVEKSNDKKLYGFIDRLYQELGDELAHTKTHEEKYRYLISREKLSKMFDDRNIIYGKGIFRLLVLNEYFKMDDMSEEPAILISDKKDYRQALNSSPVQNIVHKVQKIESSVHTELTLEESDEIEDGIFEQEFKNLVSNNIIPTFSQKYKSLCDILFSKYTDLTKEVLKKIILHIKITQENIMSIYDIIQQNTYTKSYIEELLYHQIMGIDLPSLMNNINNYINIYTGNYIDLQIPNLFELYVYQPINAMINHKIGVKSLDLQSIFPHVNIHLDAYLDTKNSEKDDPISKSDAEV